MKSAKALAALMLLFSSLFFTACTQQQEDYPETQNIITRHSWSVNEMYTGLSRMPLTDDFKITFNADGTVSMQHAAGTNTGIWKFVKNVQSDVLRVNLNPSQPGFTELNNEWIIESVSTQSITLKHADTRLLMQRL